MIKIHRPDVYMVSIEGRMTKADHYIKKAFYIAKNAGVGGVAIDVNDSTTGRLSVKSVKFKYSSSVRVSDFTIEENFSDYFGYMGPHSDFLVQVTKDGVIFVLSTNIEDLNAFSGELMEKKVEVFQNGEQTEPMTLQDGGAGSYRKSTRRKSTRRKSTRRKSTRRKSTRRKSTRRKSTRRKSNRRKRT